MYTAWGGLVCNSKETRIFEKYRDFNGDDDVEHYNTQPAECKDAQAYHHRTRQCWDKLFERDKTNTCQELADAKMKTNISRRNIMEYADERCDVYIDYDTGKPKARPVAQLVAQPKSTVTPAPTKK
jgi:hypothetical protein